MAGTPVSESAIPDDAIERYPITDDDEFDPLAEQAAQQSDQVTERKRDPEY